MTEHDPQQMAKDAASRTKFSFAQAVLDRAYPSVKVPVYLDEATSKELADLIVERAELEDRVARAGTGPLAAENAAKLEAMQGKIDVVRQRLREEEYVVTVQGISTERVEQLQKQAEEAFPTEYEESVSPITGATTRTEKTNEEKTKYLTTLLRHAHIVSITAPDGAVSDPMTVEEMAATWARLPLVARAKIDEAINATSVSVDFYRELVDEVF